MYIFIKKYLVKYYRIVIKLFFLPNNISHFSRAKVQKFTDFSGSCRSIR